MTPPVTVLAAWTSWAGVARFQVTGGYAENGGRAAVRFANGAWSCMTCLLGIRTDRAPSCPHIAAARAHYAAHGAEMPTTERVA